MSRPPEPDVQPRVAERTSALLKLGCIPGAVWGWVGTPTPAGISELFAIRETGATLLPLNASLSESEILSTLTDAGAVGVSRVADGSSAGGEAEVIVERFDSVTQQAEPALVPGTVLIRTSGTAGTPRLVLLTPAGIEHHHRAVAERMGLGREGARDAWWASLSPGHVGGLMLILRARATGAEIVATGGFDPEVFLELAREGRITHASMVPTMLLRVLEAMERDGLLVDAEPGDGRAGSADRSPPLGRLRAILVGGAAADPELLRRATAAGLPVVTTWGMTEATSQITTATPDETSTYPGQSGTPLVGVEVKVLGSGGTGVEGATGELAIRGPTLTPGDLVFGRLEHLPVDEGGWFRTGDLGHLDPQGRVVVTGRAGDRIISGGVNVDPVAVEQALRSIEGVKDAAVVGLPDPEWGERVVAAVVLDDGVAVEAVQDSVADRLTGAMRPKALYRVEALPVNANGKVDRGVVRGMLRNSSD